MVIDWSRTEPDPDAENGGKGARRLTLQRRRLPLTQRSIILRAGGEEPYRARSVDLTLLSLHVATDAKCRGAIKRERFPLNETPSQRQERILRDWRSRYC